MNFEQIERFVAIAEHRSFTLAANSVNISVSTLSKSISDLETELGNPLFIRLRNRVTLTEHGDMLYEGAAKLTGQIHELQEAVRRHDSTEPHKLKVVSVQVNPFPFCELLRGFMKRMPDLSCEMVQMEPGGTLREVLGDRFDLALTLTREAVEMKNKGSLQYLVIEKGYPTINMSRLHPLAGRVSVTAEDLRGYPLLIPLRDPDDAESSERYSNRRIMKRMFGDVEMDVRFNADILDILVWAHTKNAVFLGFSCSMGFLSGDVVTVPLIWKDGQSPAYDDDDDGIVMAWANTNPNPTLKRFIKYCRCATCRRFV